MGKTAIQLSPQERRRFRDLARRQDDKETKSALARREHALRVARAAAAVLKECFGASRVLLFGSLATQSWFHIRSDVDLAVEGLRKEDYWRADCRLEETAEGFEIDLVDLQTASPALAQTIHRDGIEI